MAVPEHVLVVDLEEPHGPGADDEVGDVDDQVEEEEPRASPHPAPFPENKEIAVRLLAGKFKMEFFNFSLVRVLTALRRQLRYRGGGGTGDVLCHDDRTF